MYLWKLLELICYEYLFNYTHIWYMLYWAFKVRPNSSWKNRQSQDGFIVWLVRTFNILKRLTKNYKQMMYDILNSKKLEVCHPMWLIIPPPARWRQVQGTLHLNGCSVHQRYGNWVLHIYTWRWQMAGFNSITFIIKNVFVPQTWSIVCTLTNLTKGPPTDR